MRKVPNYKVIKDTREQDGWFFSPYDKCSGMEVGTLNTGDYTIEGFEDVVCIERKASVSEISINLGKKKKAFYNEIERMRDFQFRYILLEFSASDLINYPLSLLKSEEDKEIYRLYKEDNARLPNYKRFDVVRQTKITGRYLLKALTEISIHHDINIMFCDNKHNAFMICNSIFKRLNESFHKEQ